MTGGGSARRRPARRAIPAGLLALLIVLGAAWGTPRAEYRAVPLSGQPAALPAAAGGPAGTAPAGSTGHARALSPTAVPPAGGRSPPVPA